MPKRSKGSNSKRIKLKDKFKVIRKVKEHHRKERKAAKKAGTKKPSLLKDPGIPSNFPYREQLVKELKFEQQRILAKEAAKKEEKKQRRLARQDGGDAADGDEEMTVDVASEMMAVRSAANKSQADFEQRVSSGLTAQPSSGDYDNSRKWFYKEFKKVVSMADVVMQVLDARDPLACRCEDIERYIRSVNPNKKIIIILNKVDLVPKEVAEQWLKYFRQELPTVAFKAATKRSGTIGHQAMPGLAAGKGQSAAQGAAALLATSECMGADTLLQLLKNYTRNQRIKTAITVGVVGMPNVGKSSVINSLKRTKVAQVGNTPGVTKTVQEIHLDKQIRLLDSPGVVFASAENAAAAALRNCVKIEKLEDPVAPVGEILKRVPAKRLMQIYRIGAFKSCDEMLQQVAMARGKLRRGGSVDVVAAARVVLQDWNDGRIPFFTRPPSRGNTEHESTAVVAAYAAEFDADTVFANEATAIIAGLQSIDDGSFVEAQPGKASRVDFASLEREEKAPAAEAAEDSDMEDMHDDPPPVASVKDASAQNALLYGEAGQVNAKLAKANRKRARKAAKAQADEAYDFADWDEPTDADIDVS